MVVIENEDTVTVEIVCDDASHYDEATGRGKLARIQRFVLDPEKGEWLAPRAVTAQDRRAPASRVVTRLGKGTGATVAQNRYFDRRTRYALKCPLCGLNPQLGQERLDKLLDGVAMAAVDEKWPDTSGTSPSRITLPLSAIVRM